MEIRQLREMKNLSRKALSEMIGVSKETLARYERKMREPRLSNIEKLCKALEVSEAELLNGLPEGEGIRITLDMKFTGEEVFYVSKDNEFRIVVDGEELGIYGQGKFPGDDGIKTFLSKVKDAITRGRSAQTVNVSTVE